ncbi:MAG: glycosyltransferase family 1 protein [Candidatus Levybacteria bacterium]|nr:glycosyltransferase family 1 protein [Candidatus Levybacteria bacterium]
MDIAIDVSPLIDARNLAHRVRGTGFYIENLKKSLLQYYPRNKYTFFTRGENLPKDTDLVHYPYFEPFFLTLPIYKKYKTIVTVHDLTPLVFPKFFPRGIKGELKWQLQKIALRRADAIITDSQSSKKDIVKKAGISDSKINVVYLAATESFRKFNPFDRRIAKVKKKFGLPDKFILYVGDVTWNKNLPRLVEAVNKINLPLVMAGKALVDKYFDKTNPWNQDLIKVQELAKGRNNIFSLGFVETEDLVSLYNSATLFTMPSIYEGFGLPILEAMQCGCPVVTTKEGSIREVTGEAGFYVDAYDINDISNGIKKVFTSDTLGEELSKKGIIQAKKFSWEKTAEETLNVYKKVVMDATI